MAGQKISVAVNSASGRAEGETTKEKILNAAEKLFAERGFYGVTVREITGEAGVDLALISYYFGSKSALFNQVLWRRAEEHSAAILAELERAEKEAGIKPPAVEAVVRSFVRPAIERLARGGDGWKNYIHLLAYLANAQQQQSFLQPMNECYDPVMRKMVDLLKRSLPATSEESVYRSFHLLMGALIHVYAETGGIDRLSDGKCNASEFDAILGHLTPFFAAGFYRMAAN